LVTEDGVRDEFFPIKFRNVVNPGASVKVRLGFRCAHAGRSAPDGRAL
jgi:hypothetical protein